MKGNNMTDKEEKISLRKLNFSAYLSGDLECFCFDVDKTTFKAIAKRNPKEYDESSLRKGMYKIYPSNIFYNIDNSQLVTVKIEVTD
jgi:hypothetical protein